MEVDFSGFHFFSNFDSGNLNRVEPGEPAADEPDTALTFDLWTRPDCHGSEFENGNRTWFHFGVSGSSITSRPASSAAGEAAEAAEAGPCWVRLTVRNLNKQSKLFSQGMTPIVSRSAAQGGGRGPRRWERLRERPTFWNEDNHFVLSFRLRLDPQITTFVAFTYPFSYREAQTFLARLEKRHDCAGLGWAELEAQTPPGGIYFHRELVCLTSEGRRVDLVTLSSSRRILSVREAELGGLFGHGVRPFQFRDKPVIFISARVHPGETQSSFVFNGLLRFLLRETDPRAVTLRDRYVFKLMPMLNPDGVFRGHYRTDLRGVNLNRVYGTPSTQHHMPIWAAKKLILYAHLGRDDNPDTASQSESSALSTCEPPPPLPPMRWLRSSEGAPNVPEQFYEMTETSRCSEGDESITDFSIAPGAPPVVRPTVPLPAAGPTSFAGAFAAAAQPSTSQATWATPPSVLPLDEDAQNPCDAHPGMLEPPPVRDELDERIGLDFAERLKDTLQATTTTGVGHQSRSRPAEGGLFLYVDIHGHASKRGVFMYGNHFRDLSSKVETMLLPKLMSINCANFDFPGCNFTQKNMYMKDRHTGAGKEGSGRVSVFKSTGLVNAYTLECNFNTGRVVNPIPNASRDGGRATPPPPLDTTPPKYDPAIYEDVGKSLAISILDLTESNPWSRLTCSPHKNLKGVKESIRKYIRQNEEQQKVKAAQAAASPKTKGARNRSTSSSGGKAKASSATRGKAPLSPEAYRPLSKVARKSSTVARNLQHQLQQQPKVSLSPGKLAKEASLEDERLCQRSKITRSQSLSTPNSRPSSPRRTMVASPASSEGGAQRRSLKKKPTAVKSKSLSKTRKSGGDVDPSEDVSGTDVGAVGPKRKKSLTKGGKKRKPLVKTALP